MAEEAEDELALTVLGTISCRRGGVAVALGGPQQRRVLAALVADVGKVVPLGRLVEAIWSEEALDLWHGRAYGEFATEWWALPLSLIHI